MPTVELRVTSGSQTGTLIPLAEGKFLIGREQDCHLRPNSELVSRHHCVFTRDTFSLRLRDLGSTNGTFVNGERIETTTILKPGDRIIVGKLDLVVVIDGVPAVDGEDTIYAAREETVAISRQGNTVTPATAANSGASAPPASGFDIELMADDLSFLENAEKEAVPAADEATATIAVSHVDTREFNTASPAVPTPEGYPAEAGQAPQMPPNPWMAPQYAYPPPGYPQYPPPGMPPYGYGYPYPGMPQMPPQGYGYPPPMGYPQGMPPMQAPPVEAAPEATPSALPPGTVDYRLPDPATTGAKAPEAPPPPKPEEAGKPKAHIPTAAQDLIHNMLNRRPKT